MFYTELAILTAGVSLAMGSISFFIGLENKEKTDLIFGLMGFSLFVFFLLPPVGFILVDHAPYPREILVKRIFIHAYYALIPWFILHYTGFGKKGVPILINALVIVCYVIMFMTTEDKPKPIWSMYAVMGFGSIFMYGFIAGIWQYRNSNEKSKASWFIFSMTIYGILFLLTAINQLSNNAIERAMNMKLFFPMHFHALLLMFIMGMRVVVDVFEKHRLQKVLKARDRRWQSFMQNAPMIVMELDRSGSIVYINDFGRNLLRFDDSDDLIGKNWFDTFAPSIDAQNLKLLYEELIKERKAPPYFRNAIRTRKGNEMAMSWVNFLTYSDEGEVFGIMCIGRDLTEENSANRMINQLKLELEKEKFTFSEPAGIVMPEEIIGKGEAIGYAIQKAQQVASTNAPVLLEGETGVGKDLLADVIHKISSRNTMPFIKVNCGALPKELIEDELFGHEKGAFTSAIQARKGRFELADGGSIFLDEIGELPLEMQPKLLRVLQNGEFERVGGQKTTKVDVRIIAATNRDLSHEVAQGNFRADLYYRLNVFPITIPPLRKRKEDLPELINYFIVRKTKEYGKKLEQISKADFQRLIDYHWPGNVRELKNVIERAVITSSGDTLRLDWFPGQKEQVTSSHSVNTLEQIEKEHILKVMEECHWKINGENGAAEKLDMHPNTLRSKMKKLNICRPQKDLNDSLVKNGSEY